jgi:hypothetical protein
MDIPKKEKECLLPKEENRDIPTTNNINNEEKEDKGIDFDEDSSSHESIFNDSISEKKEEEKDNGNKIENLFLGAKKKRELTEEEKAERIKKNIERYCKRNERMLELLEKINNNETTRKNINEMMRLLAIDLSDTKKLTNRKALISQRKRELFNKLFDLTFTEYQYFWYQLTQGQYKKGNAQLINSSNMKTAKMIYKNIIENRKKGDEKNKEKTVKQIIDDRKNKDIENDKLDEYFLGFDSDISSDEDSLDSSIDESFSDNESSKKAEKEKEENEKKEKIRKEKEEKEEKEEIEIKKKPKYISSIIDLKEDEENVPTKKKYQIHYMVYKF